MSEHQTESLIQQSAPTAPRITPEDLDQAIDQVIYFTGDQAHTAAYPDRYVPKALNLMTFCIIILKNGFTVTGQSACVSPENYRKDIGEKIAYENARNQLWPLLGFHLKECLHLQSINHA